ncbi:MAG TPA: hypothetical protein VEQ87_00990 [Burkholderiales bacterium]|nr:hypothetical protein [Burkholderiales bacterium]
MKKLFALLAVATAFASPVHAREESDHWFNDGLAYYQHPCGWDAFVKYGKIDTPENRHNYYLTLQHPELCSKVFP